MWAHFGEIEAGLHGESVVVSIVIENKRHRYTVLCLEKRRANHGGADCDKVMESNDAENIVPPCNAGEALIVSQF